MNILIIGAGGREHALAKAFEKSEYVTKVFVAPGNPGIMLESTKIRCISIPVTDNNQLVQFAKENDVTYTVVGPETSIESGVVDRFREHHLQIVGPTQEAGQIETSKSFAKRLMEKAEIPTAQFKWFQPSQFEEAKSYVESLPFPIVIKENGLAGGKGVYICEDKAYSEEILAKMMQQKGSEVVIEEFLEGVEFSHFSLINEDHIISLGVARDYKRALDGDKGLNTGGMGAISPISPEDSTLNEEIVETVVSPLIKQMKQEGVPYTGVLYTGIMKTKTGLKVIEFNVRFGDPETQVLLPLIQTDWIDILNSHFLKQPLELDYSTHQSLGVVLAAKGYPEKYERGFELSLPAKTADTTLYYSGISAEEGNLMASGGRILMVTAQAENFEECRKNVYSWLEQIDSDQMFYRKDIGLIHH